MARADHIMVSRLGGVFYHHGIDCGDGSVIHFTGETWSTPRSVQRTPIELFRRGGAVEVRDYTEFFERLRQPDQLPRRMTIGWRRKLGQLVSKAPESRALDPDAVIARATSRLGRVDFDLVLNNCEHFATWCKTGISDSEQVYALWRSVMDPMNYLRLRRSDLLTALLDGGPPFVRAAEADAAVRPGTVRRPPRRSRSPRGRR